MHLDQSCQLSQLHPDPADAVALAAQGARLQGPCCSDAPVQGAPFCCSRIATHRLRSCKPSPQVTEQKDHALQSLQEQSMPAVDAMDTLRTAGSRAPSCDRKRRREPRERWIASCGVDSNAMVSARNSKGKNLIITALQRCRFRRAPPGVAKLLPWPFHHLPCFIIRERFFWVFCI